MPIIAARHARAARPGFVSRRGGLVGTMGQRRSAARSESVQVLAAGTEERGSREARELPGSSDRAAGIPAREKKLSSKVDYYNLPGLNSSNIGR
jgi:hypothetical protein